MWQGVLTQMGKRVRVSVIESKRRLKRETGFESALSSQNAGSNEKLGLSQRYRVKTPTQTRK